MKEGVGEVTIYASPADIYEVKRICMRRIYEMVDDQENLTDEQLADEIVEKLREYDEDERILTMNDDKIRLLCKKLYEDYFHRVEFHPNDYDYGLAL